MAIEMSESARPVGTPFQKKYFSSIKVTSLDLSLTLNLNRDNNLSGLHDQSF